MGLSDKRLTSASLAGSSAPCCPVVFGVPSQRPASCLATRKSLLPYNTQGCENFQAKICSGGVGSPTTNFDLAGDDTELGAGGPLVAIVFLDRQLKSDRDGELVNGKITRVFGVSLAKIGYCRVAEIGMSRELIPRPFKAVGGNLINPVDELVKLDEIVPLVRREVGFSGRVAPDNPEFGLAHFGHPVLALLSRLGLWHDMPSQLVMGLRNKLRPL